MSSLIDDFNYGTNVANSDVKVRLGFLRKVYGILSIQLTFTAVCGLVIIMADVGEFIKLK
jgi:protein lifeguard